MPNEYMAEEGMGWIEQWAITRGHPPTGVPAMGHRSLESFAASPHAAVIPNEVSLAISNIALRSGKETAETMLFFVLAVPKSKDSS